MTSSICKVDNVQKPSFHCSSAGINTYVTYIEFPSYWATHQVQLSTGADNLFAIIGCVS